MAADALAEHLPADQHGGDGSQGGQHGGDADAGVVQGLEPHRQVEPEQQAARQRPPHHRPGDAPAGGDRDRAEDDGDHEQPPEGDVDPGQVGLLGQHAARRPARRRQQDGEHREGGHRTGRVGLDAGNRRLGGLAHDDEPGTTEA
jgi:hypothetical protein